MNTHNNIFELFCRNWNSLKWERLMIKEGMLPTNRQTPDQLDLRLMLIPTCLTTHPSEECPWSEPLWTIIIKLSHSLPQVGTHGFEGISPLWPPLPSKETKLSFSITSKEEKKNHYPSKGKITTFKPYVLWLKDNLQKQMTLIFLSEMSRNPPFKVKLEGRSLENTMHL